MMTTGGVVKAENSQWDEEKLWATSNIDIELDAITQDSLSDIDDSEANLRLYSSTGTIATERIEPEIG